jgi:signal transduction histidine kinase
MDEPRVEVAQRSDDERLTALADFGRLVFLSGSLVETFRAAIETALLAIPAHGCEIWEFDRTNQTLVVVDGRHEHDRPNPISAIPLNKRNPVARAFLARRPIVDEGHGPDTTIAVIVRGKSEPYGVLAVYVDLNADISLADIAFARAVANTLAFATQVSKDENALWVREREQAAVAELGRQALSGVALGEILQSTTELVAELCGFDYAHVMKFDAGQRRLVPVAGVGWKPAPGFYVNLDDEVPAARAFRTNNDVVVHNASSGGKMSEAVRALGVHSALSVVIRGRGAPFGTLSVGSLGQRTFLDAEVSFVRSLANTLAAAIEHHLFEESQAFSYGVAHDLRTPLRAIAGFSQALAEDCAPSLDATGNRYLERILTATERMGSLIDALLDYAQLADREVHRTAVDLSAIAQTVAGDLCASDPERRVDISIAPGMSAHADRALVANVIANLMGNAWKFSKITSHAKIEVGHEQPDGEHIFWVRDNGIGFEQGNEPQLYTPFKRFHGEEYAGVGLGLASVDRIVRRHGGRLWARGAPGVGATFYFTLERGAQS